VFGVLAIIIHFAIAL